MGNEMAAVSYNMRIDQELRDKAFPVLDSYGLTPSQAFKLFLKQVANTNTVPLSFDYQQGHTLSPNGEALLLESIAALKNGEYVRYHTVDEALTGLLELAK